jgi:hypothetical protein
MRSLGSRVSSDMRVIQTPWGVFLYAASAHAAVQAEQVLREVLAEHGVMTGVRRDQWNPVSKRWTSHEEVMKAERGKSAATGRAQWQVHVRPSSHHELKALARGLEAEGLPVARRWRYLIVGGSCEDEAHALADRIQGYGSAGTRIRVQPGVYDLPKVRAWTLPPGAWW